MANEKEKGKELILSGSEFGSKLLELAREKTRTEFSTRVIDIAQKLLESKLEYEKNFEKMKQEVALIDRRIEAIEQGKFRIIAAKPPYLVFDENELNDSPIYTHGEPFSRRSSL